MLYFHSAMSLAILMNLIISNFFSAYALGSLSKFTNQISQTSAPNKQPICLFLHGARGDEAKQPESIQLELAGYAMVQKINPTLWGDMRQYTHCRKIYYNLSDTLHQTWDNSALAKTYYNFASGCQKVSQMGECQRWLSLTERPNKVFTHSMGSLVLAGYCYSHASECQQFGPQRGQIHWYNVQGALKGTPVAKQVDTWCRSNSGINSWLSRYYGACGYRNGEWRANKTNLSLEPGYKPELSSGAIAAQAYRYLSGAVCGTSPWGSGEMTLLQPFNTGMWGVKLGYLWLMTVMDNSSHSSLDSSKTEHDGFIPTSSCLGNYRFEFQSTYKQRFYLAQSNHIEGTAIAPDSWQCIGISETHCIRYWYYERTQSQDEL